MRRLIITLLLVVATLPALEAQRRYRPDFAIGGKAGATVSSMSFSPHVDQTWTPGFMAGFVARYIEQNHFGIIAELNVEQRGWKEKYEKGEPFSYRRIFTYIQLPLLTHIYFGNDRFRGFFNAGPEVGYMIGSSISANFDYANPGSVEGYPAGYRNSEQLNKKVENRFDYGISAGVGMEMIFRHRHSVLIEGRFYYGLGNIFHASKKDYFSASRGMSIEVTAAYLFRLR